MKEAARKKNIYIGVFSFICLSVILALSISLPLTLRKSNPVATASETTTTVSETTASQPTTYPVPPNEPSQDPQRKNTRIKFTNDRDKNTELLMGSLLEENPHLSRLIGDDGVQALKKLIHENWKKDL